MRYVCTISLSVAFAAFWMTTAFAASESPAGRWVTIDDKDHQPRSMIEIVESGGALQGQVIKIYDRPGDNPGHLCRKCKGDLKDKPVVGMTVLSGLKQDGDAWDGGTIMDPDSGSTYSATLRLIEGGEKLNVRGYLGISLFGRSQTWVREGATASR